MFISSGGSWYKVAAVKQQEEEWEVGKSLKKRISQVVVQVVSNKFLKKRKVRYLFYQVFLVNFKPFRGYVEVKSVNYWESEKWRSENVTYYLK